MRPQIRGHFPGLRRVPHPSRAPGFAEACGNSPRAGRTPKPSSISGPGPAGGRPSGLTRLIIRGLISGGHFPGLRR
eukprot:7300060-Alexandrium_andersonii.AAC.1